MAGPSDEEPSLERAPRLRSRAALTSRPQAFAFGARLWTPILKQVRPELMICIDRETHEALRGVLAGLGFLQADHASFPTGWGKYTADVTTFQTKAGARRPP